MSGRPHDVVRDRYMKPPWHVMIIMPSQRRCFDQGGKAFQVCTALIVTQDTRGDMAMTR